MAKWSFAKQYNKERLFDIDTSGFDYYNLEEIFDGDEETVWQFRGLYINTKGNFEPQPVVALKDGYVNLPAHMCDVCKEMLKDRRFIAAVNMGTCGFTIYQYEQKRFNKDCYAIRWIDVDPLKPDSFRDGIVITDENGTVLNDIIH